MARHKKLLYGVAAFMVLVGMVACAYNVGYVKTTYDMLAVSQTSYDMAMSTAVDLYRQGRITDSDKEKIFAKGKEFALAHNAAVDALVSYAETRDAADQELMEAQVKIAASALGVALELLKPYLLGE